MRHAENHHHHHDQQMACVVGAAAAAVNDRLIDCNHRDPYSDRQLRKVQHRNGFKMNLGFGN